MSVRPRDADALHDHDDASVWSVHEHQGADVRAADGRVGLEFLKITFSQQEDDPLVDIEEIRELLDEDIKEGDDE